jgi:hypothetical protein
VGLRGPLIPKMPPQLPALGVAWFRLFGNQDHAHNICCSHNVKQQGLARHLEHLSASSVQTKGPDFHRSLKNGRARSASPEINRLSTAKRSMSFCTSLMWAGGRITSIVLIFSGLTSIPWCKTKKQFACCHPEHSLVRVQLHACGAQPSED